MDFKLLCSLVESDNYIEQIVEAAGHYIPQGEVIARHNLCHAIIHTLTEGTENVISNTLNVN